MAYCVVAQETENYEKAYALFEAAEYHQALTQFEALLAIHPNNPALIYDVGLCHNYLKQFTEAENYFTQLLDHPDYVDWATYQLAMNDWQQGYLGAAEIGFSQVVFNSDDADLVELATVRYAELLQAQTTTSPANANVWFGSLGLGFGQDDNIVDPRFLDATDQQDDYQEFTGNLVHLWLGEDNLPTWEISGFFIANRFADIDSADFNVVAVEAKKYFYSGAWEFGLGVGLERSTSGGEDYLSQTALNVDIRSDHDIANKGWTISYRRADAEALSSEFDQLAGISQSLQIAYSLPLGNNWYLKAGSEWLQDDRDALPINTNVLSDLSADRSGVEVALGLRLRNFNIELKIEDQDSDYDDIARVGLISFDRKDQRDTWQLRANLNLADDWVAYAEYLNVDNVSNFSRFTYQQETVVAGINWYF